MTENQTVRVGIDMGGSKSAVVFQLNSQSDQHVQSFTTLGANLAIAGTVKTAGLVSATLARVRAEFADPITIHCVAGIAGAGRSDSADALNHHVRQTFTNPLDRFQSYPDYLIAVEGAFSGKPGAVVIIGTGSGVFGKDASGTWARAGGWGPRLGDAGSGEQLGRMALKAVASALEGGPDTLLASMIGIGLGINERSKIIEAVYDQKVALSTLAPFVLEAAERQDEVALSLLGDEASELAKEVGQVLDQLDESSIALIGGLSGNPVYRSILEQAFREVVPDVQVQAPEHPPEIGALRLTENLPA